MLNEKFSAPWFGLRSVMGIVALFAVTTACGDAQREAQPLPQAKAAEVELSTLEAQLTSQEWPSDALVVTNSIQLDQRGRFEGTIAATRAAGAVLAHGAEVALELNSHIVGSVRADTLYLAGGSDVSANATYNSISGSGEVLGNATTPLSLPLPVTLPQLPTFSAGSQIVTLGINEVRTLQAGVYGAATLAQSNDGGTTKLNLVGGTYTFSSITVGTRARIECQAECEVRVVGRVSSAARSYFGPAAIAGLGAGNVRLLVKGSNVGGTPASTPSACTFGNDATLAAWTLVPNGTLRLDQRVNARGKFVARDVVIGSDSGGIGLELPIVVQAPQDVNVWEHQPAPFSVAATGTGITYQWQRNGANIAGATSASYTLPSSPWLKSDRAQRERGEAQLLGANPENTAAI